jgi:CheY-like chemotaxis protein
MDKENTSQKYHIVLVDDEPRIHEMIGEILKEAKFAEHIESFYDPLSFLEFLKQEKDDPDMILLDVHFENSGLNGVEIIPYIREDYPYLPVILLTGMEGAEIEDAQNYDCVYYIPKPVKPEHLMRMVGFYLGMGRKSGQRSEEMTRDIEEHRKHVQLLKKELAEAEISSWDKEKSVSGNKETKAFQRVMDILSSVLDNCDLLPSFTHDMEKLFDSDFALFKKAVDTIIRFDLSNFSSPGLNIHKYKGESDVYSLRLTKKARIFFCQSQNLSNKKLRLIRLDPEHDTRAMDKWLKANHETYV